MEKAMVPSNPDARRIMEDEDEVEVSSLRWWDFGDKIGEDDEEKEIQQIELEEHMTDVWEKVGAGGLERWVARVKRDTDEREDEEKEKFAEAEEDYE